LYDVAESCCSQQQIAEAPTSLASSSYTPWAIAGGAALALLAIKRVYDTPSRSYNNNVGDEYDAWTDEGILEYYWGEHIHLGYYTEEERAQGWWKADFKAAKLRFTQEMFNFSGSQAPKRILDVGCGFGGSSRWLAAQFPDAEVTGEPVAVCACRGEFPMCVSRGGGHMASSDSPCGGLTTKLDGVR
jgi:MPBQ/MSBQ methyltransferase